MFTFGFYDSLNGDRKYNATQMASIFDGIINDGVYANIGEHFDVAPGTGLQVIVKTGRAWFKHTWNLNDAWLPINLAAADPLRPRIDAIVIEVNSNLAVRENSIKVITGTPATSPVAPTMIHEDGIDQYRLANVNVAANATYITAANITIRVGTSDAPYVTAPLQVISVDNMLTKWEAEWDAQVDEWGDEFYTWFNNLKLQLTDDVVTNLQNQINERVKIADKATATDIKNGTVGKWVDANMAKSELMNVVNGLAIGDIVYSTRDLEAETSGKMLACNERSIEVSKYPKLCAVPKMAERYEDLYYADSPPSTSWPGASNTIINQTQGVFLGGNIQGEYLYCVQYSKPSTYVLYTITRYKITNGSSAVAETIATNVTTNWTGVNQNVYFYIANNCIWILSSYWSTWYSVDISSGVVQTYTDNILQSTNGTAYATITSNGEVVIYMYAHYMSYSSSNSILYYSYAYDKYSKDLKSRTRIKQTSHTQVTIASGVRFTDYVAGRILGSYQLGSGTYFYPNGTMHASLYNKKALSAMNDYTASGFYLLGASMTGTGQWADLFGLFMLFSENGNTTYKHYTVSETNLTTLVTGYGGYISNIYAGGSTDYPIDYCGNIIVNNNYVIFINNICYKYEQDSGTGVYYYYYGTYVIVINKSTKNIVKTFLSEHPLIGTEWSRTSYDNGTSKMVQTYMTIDETHDYLYSPYLGTDGKVHLGKLKLDTTLQHTDLGVLNDGEYAIDYLGAPYINSENYIKTGPLITQTGNKGLFTPDKIDTYTYNLNTPAANTQLTANLMKSRYFLLMPITDKWNYKHILLFGSNMTNINIIVKIIKVNNYYIIVCSTACNLFYITKFDKRVLPFERDAYIKALE